MSLVVAAVAAFDVHRGTERALGWSDIRRI